MKRKPGVWVVERKFDDARMFNAGLFETRKLAVEHINDWYVLPQLYRVARYVKEK